MRLCELELTNVRTFRSLELTLEAGAHVVWGMNGAGKTNLLESILLLATARQSRGGADIDLISWDSLQDDPLPAARVAAKISDGRHETSLDIAVIAGAEGSATRRASKRFRVNGLARRASELVGELRAVMFSADDLHIIDGAPAGRRRYLDITLAQLSRNYVRLSQRYARVLQQRNSLLRRLQERRGQLDELDFWDDELASAAAGMFVERESTLREIGRDAAERYTEFAAPGEGLEIQYQPALPPELADAIREHDLEERFRAALGEARREDVYRGATRFGPHRDDFTIMISGHPAATSASRGQQRTAALTLRLAEVALSTTRTGDPPILLLDDILSELDAARRSRVLQAAFGVDQAIITTPDPDRPARSDLPDARWHRIEHGAVLDD